MIAPIVPRKKSFFSSISGEIIVLEWFGKKTLYTQGVAQSGGEYVAMWRRVLKNISQESIKKCLVLGLGGGTVIEALILQHKDIKITAIEKDPVIVDIAKTYFGLEARGDVQLIIADANDWVEKNKKRFNLIVVDLYKGRLNPSFCRQKTFLIKLKKSLMPAGQILFNAHFQPDNRKEFEKFLTLCKTVFDRVNDIFSYRYNHVLLLS